MEYYIDSPNVQRLAELYIQNGVVGKESRIDATHVAHAALHGCDGLVSWNFKHIVHPDKCALFNLVNAAHGHPQLFIVSPREAMRHDKDE